MRGVFVILALRYFDNAVSYRDNCLVICLIKSTKETLTWQRSLLVVLGVNLNYVMYVS